MKTKHPLWQGILVATVCALFTALCVAESPKTNVPIDVLLAAAKNTPTDYEAWNRLADAQLIAGDLKALAVTVAKMTQLKDSDPRGLFFAGVVHLDNKRFEEALKVFQRAATINPEYARAWRGVGFSYDGMRKYEEAIAALNKSLTIDPDHAHTWARLGLAYQELKQWDHVTDAFEHAVKLSSTNQQFWTLLASAYKQNNEPEKEAAVYGRAKLARQTGDPRIEKSDPTEITTLDGRTFTSVKVLKVQSDGLLTLYAGGGGLIKFTNLPQELQIQYDYDPIRAAVQQIPVRPQHTAPVIPATARPVNIDIEVLRQKEGTNAWGQQVTWEISLKTTSQSRVAIQARTQGRLTSTTVHEYGETVFFTKVVSRSIAKAKDAEDKPQVYLHSVSPNEIEEMRSIFTKLTQWDEIARAKHAQPFHKLIKTVGQKDYEFWYSDSDPQSDYGSTLSGTMFNARDIRMFLELLELWPEIRKEFDGRLRKAQEEQDTLFK